VTREYHEVLHQVSLAYPSLGGMLHTRYAPVRHSCTPERALPFDLHVLGLPLAFILSQDQTLHCNSTFCVSGDINPARAGATGRTRSPSYMGPVFKSIILVSSSQRTDRFQAETLLALLFHCHPDRPKTSRMPPLSKRIAKLRKFLAPQTFFPRKAKVLSNLRWLPKRMQRYD
jgi:hypothetical protein